jgi:hypothetical protein
VRPEKRYIYYMKLIYYTFIVTFLLAISSCRKPRQGDFEMVLSGNKVITNEDSSGVTVNTTPYSSSSDMKIKKSKKSSLEVGDMLWNRSGTHVTYAKTNTNISAIISGNSSGSVIETTATVYDGTVKSNNSVEGTFSFSYSKVNGSGEYVEATTGTFSLHRK